MFKISDNFDKSIECKWQDKAFDYGYTHISVFCSLGQFVTHITDLLRDYRYDKYESMNQLKLMKHLQDIISEFY